MYLFLFSIMLILIIMFLFQMASKMFLWELSKASSFECGFSSNFMSRFSFSMHFYLVGIIFLFLDLELCFIMPFFNEGMSSLKMSLLCWTFILFLMMGILKEWHSGKLEWKF